MLRVQIPQLVIKQIIKIALHSNLRGPGYWKLNTSFLTDIDYVTQIRDIIKKTHEEYQDNDTANKVLLWEMMKLDQRAVNKVHDG